MQYTALTHSDSAGGTGNRGNLPRRQFSLFHRNRVRHSYPFECSILNNLVLAASVWKCRGIRTGAKICSVVPDNTKEGFIDVDSAVILELLGGIALREDGCFILECGDFSIESGGVQKQFHVKRSATCPRISSRLRGRFDRATPDRGRGHTAEYLRPPSCRLFNIAQPQLLAESKMQPPL